MTNRDNNDYLDFLFLQDIYLCLDSGNGVIIMCTQRLFSVECNVGDSCLVSTVSCDLNEMNW